VKTFLPTLILMLLCASVLAQPPPRPPRPQQDREHRAREWRELQESLTEAERRAFREMAPKERRRFVRERQKQLRNKRRQAQEKKFLATLPEQQRTKLAALPGKERSAAILRIRIDRRLEKILKEAASRNLIDEEAVRAIRAEKNLKKRARRVLELQKTVFLATFKDALEAMPERRRARLLKLSPREFFRHPAIKRLPLIHFFDIRRVRRLARREPQVRGRLLEAARKGKLIEGLKLLFRPGRLAEFLKLGQKDQREILRQIPRLAGPPRGRDRRPPPPIRD